MIFENIDCMELMKKYPDKYFDIAIVDPPYGIKDFTERDTFKKIEWNDNIPSKKYFDELFRVSKNQIVWGGNYYTEFLKPSKSWVIWDKKITPLCFHDRGEMAWTNFKKPMNIVEIVWTSGFYRKNKENIIHPCQKPVALYKWLAKNYCKQTDLILDTHVGSASSLIAFEDMGLDYVGCELDKEYYDKACERIKKYRSQPKLFESNFDQ